MNCILYRLKAQKQTSGTIRNALLVCSALVSGFVIDPAVAQTATNSGTSQSAGIETVTVTAEKRSEDVAKVPMSISVLSGEALDHSTVEGATEALTQVPGVAVSPYPVNGGTQVTVRGVTAAGALFEGSSPIAYYLDGVPFGLIRTAILPDEDIYDLQRIEVLRGPQGTLYGASALNGVVRLLTHDADLDNFDIKARTSVSDTDGGGVNYRGDVAVNIPIVTDKLAARAVVGYEGNSGWIDSPVKSNVNSSILRTYRLKVDAQPTENLSIGLSAWSSNNSYAAPSTGNDQEKISSTVPNPIKTGFDTLGLKIGYNFSDFSIESNTSYLKFKNQSAFDLTPFGAPFSLVTHLSGVVVSEEAVATSTNNVDWRWSIGGMFRHATENTTQNDAPVSFINDTSQSWAVFGELTRLLFDDHLEITLGLRQFEDRVSQFQDLTGFPNDNRRANFHALSPRAVITWYPDSNTTIYASYAQGFRSGFPQELPVPATFPAVKGDKLTNYELGTKKSLFGDRLTIDASGYYIDWSKIQEALTVEYNGLPYSAEVNGNRASGFGFDIAATTNPTDSLTLGINFSINNLHLTSQVVSGGVVLFNKGDRPNNSPAITFGPSIDYTFQIGDFPGDAQITANYTSRQCQRQVLGPSEIIGCGDPVWVGRAHISLKSPDGHWTGTFYADNFNNFTGKVMEGLYDVPDWDLRLRPRTIGLEIQYDME